MNGYARVRGKLAADACVILDGGVATELPGDAHLDDPGWGIRALAEVPDAVAAVHRAYVAAGADVISTNTWGLTSAAQDLHWMDLGRRGIALARAAATGGQAVAFSLNGDVDAELGDETARLLRRMFAPGPPDLILLETLSLTPDERTLEALLATELPVWLSFRRCRHGLCGVYGQHWGGPEGDAFGRAARRLEQLGIDALLVNCIPPDHVEGMVSFLRDFVDLPLGVYPNLGYHTERGWRFDEGVDGAEYAGLAARWREEGAQIVGGCCGVRPEHVAAARERLEGTRPGHRRPAPPDAAAPEVAPWTDARDRTLYPLPLPEIVVETGVIAPGPPSLMAWRHLFAEGIGAGRRCLDAGCGSGLLAVQLARNGAAHVHAIDIDQRAVTCTLANAFRNDVSDRLTAATVDLYPWVPDERYEVIVASLPQRPADPREAGASHRQADYWGRLLLDQLIAKLPAALAPEGVAFVVHLSVVSQRQTAALLAGVGLEARVVDFAVFADDLDRTQLKRVEAHTDAHHLSLGLGAYLLEVRHVR